jgi:hypothetical protein
MRTRASCGRCSVKDGNVSNFHTKYLLGVSVRTGTHTRDTIRVLRPSVSRLTGSPVYCFAPTKRYCTSIIDEHKRSPFLKALVLCTTVARLCHNGYLPNPCSTGMYVFHQFLRSNLKINSDRMLNTGVQCGIAVVCGGQVTYGLRGNLIH